MSSDKIYLDANFAVLGLGISGASACDFLLGKCKNLYCWDEKNISKKYSSIAKEPSFWLDKIDYLVVSPGIKYEEIHNHPIIDQARKNNVKLICDIEVFALYKDFYQNKDKLKIILISGTNGKSTTVSMIHEALKFNHKTSMLVGNIGNPILSVFNDKFPEYLVIEISSFQIPLSPSLKADIGAIINITPDHIDRHGSFENYEAIKFSLGDMLVNDGYFLLDELSFEKYKNKFEVTNQNVINIGFNIDRELKIKTHQINDQEISLEISKLKLRGEFNYQNYAFCVAILKLLQIAEIENACYNFNGLAHRQEEVRTIKNIKFINDSKATNLYAAKQAFSNFENIFWLVGGLRKEDVIDIEDYKEKIKYIFCFGKDGPFFYDKLKGKFTCFLYDNMEQSLAKAYEISLGENNNIAKEKTILLSPACASFDQFKSFEDRGNKFKIMVNNL